MGYRVMYGELGRDLCKGKIRPGRTMIMTVAVCMLFLSAACRLWPEGAAVMDRLEEFQGFQEVHCAMEHFAMEIRNGVNLREAVTAFCRNVVNMGLQYAA